MKNPIQIIKKYFNLMEEGKTFRDKFIIFIYFVQMPVRLIFKFIGYKGNGRLISDVTLKNKDGIFFCGNSIFSVWTGSVLGEEDLRKYFNLDKGVFIDIGANIGKYTIKLGNQLKKKGKVISIEPEPINFKALSKNVKLNKLENVFLENVACSDKEGFMDFYIDYVGDYGGGHSLIKNEISRKKIKVKTKKLDSILDELKIKKVDLIKIDVEGAESLVLKGGLKTLKNSHPKIIIEAWDKKHLDKVKEILKPFNYKIKQISKENYFCY